MPKPGMVVTDLDGTLFQSERRISARNYRTLEDLGSRRVLRVVATGRHLLSARRVLADGFPIDFLIFSSGAGILAWRSQKLLRSISMSEEEVASAFEAFSSRSLDFMVHRPIPHNHHFVYYSSGEGNPDFEARCALYREFAKPGRPGLLPMRKACQLLAIEPYFRSFSRYRQIKAQLPGLTVIRTTSPLDGKSRWLEIFPGRVSKALASRWLARTQGIREDRILAVGNDFNDLDLLRWAAKSFAVGGAPEELAGQFPVVRGGDESDFSEAVAIWRRECQL
jgi:hydroxymethylpyrimidine pyrophosphatase-like HAD family hydrolase